MGIGSAVWGLASSGLASVRDWGSGGKWERKREGVRKTARERDTQKQGVCKCVCECWRARVREAALFRFRFSGMRFQDVGFRTYVGCGMYPPSHTQLR